MPTDPDGFHSDGFDLPVLQFDWCRSPEDLAQNGDLTTMLVERVDRPFEAFEGTFLDLDDFAHLKGHLDDGFGDL